MIAMKTMYKYIAATAAMLFFVVGSTFAQITLTSVTGGSTEDFLDVSGYSISYGGCGSRPTALTVMLKGGNVGEQFDVYIEEVTPLTTNISAPSFGFGFMVVFNLIV